MNNGTRWVAEEEDLEAMRALVGGLSRGLTSVEGGVGATLPGCSAGQTRSPYNVLTPATTVTASRTRSTHEQHVWTAMASLANTSAYHYSLAMHDKIGAYAEENLEPAEYNGRTYKAIVVSDPDPVWRLRARGGDLEDLYASAAERSGVNPALDQFQPVVLDKILYIPHYMLKKFRPSSGGGGTYPDYGSVYTVDPRTSANTSKICLMFVLGAGSLLHGTRKRVWTTFKPGDHDKGGEYAFHFDSGWTRREYDANDGRTEMENPHMAMVAVYDAGQGVAIGS